MKSHSHSLYNSVLEASWSSQLLILSGFVSTLSPHGNLTSYSLSGTMQPVSRAGLIQAYYSFLTSAHPSFHPYIPFYCCAHWVKKKEPFVVTVSWRPLSKKPALFLLANCIKPVPATPTQIISTLHLVCVSNHVYRWVNSNLLHVDADVTKVKDQ